MPHCYLLAVCAGSSLDRDTNGFSLFNLVEDIQLNIRPDLDSDQTLPLETHHYWTFQPAELNQQFEIRLQITVVEASRTIYTEALQVEPPTPKYRFRSAGFVVSGRGGRHELRVQWRTRGQDEWMTEPSLWPVNIAFVPA